MTVGSQVETGLFLCVLGEKITIVCSPDMPRLLTSSYKCTALDEVHRSECMMPTFTPHKGIRHSSVR